LFNHLASNKRADKVSDLFQEMINENVKPDINTFNSMLHCYAVVGDKYSLKRILNQMKRYEVNPDVVTFSTLIHGYEKGGDFEQCWETYQNMKKNNILPNKMTFNSLLSACGYLRKLEYIEVILQEMEQVGVIPDVIHYGTIATAYSRCHRIVDAISIFKLLKTKGLSWIGTPVYRFLHHIESIIPNHLRNTWVELEGVVNGKKEALNQQEEKLFNTSLLYIAFFIIGSFCLTVFSTRWRFNHTRKVTIWNSRWIEIPY